MNNIAKIFTNGRSQAVRLPAEFRFDSKEVYIYRNDETGDVILSRRPKTWDGFVEALQKAKAPSNFLNSKERRTTKQLRDPFEGHEK